MDKVKFSKLRLPSSKRSTPHSQITRFFAQSQQSEVVTIGDEDTNEAQEAVYYQSLPLPDPPSSAQEDQPPEATTTRPFTQFEYASAKERKYRRNDASARSPPPPNAIKEFFDQSIGENDFEQPKEVVKKAKKPTTATTTTKRKKCRPSKKQPTIRNALLQQEKLFSNILAEQSFAENVDPNELQLALALSRSELETCRVEGDANMDIDGGSSNSAETLQLKLEEFGYKVKRNLNDNLSLYTTNKKRGKWANKFTPLTMRNEEQQMQKIRSKIEQVLNKHTDVIDHDIGCNYAITSTLLSSIQSQEPIYQRHRLDDTAPLIQFYVNKIVEPTTVKAGYLLKDFRSIPGRDLSPKKRERDMSDKLVEELKNVSPKTIETENEPCINQPESNRNFNRANSPDLFEDSEIEEYQEISLVPATKASTMESLVLSSSNSEQITTCENLENCAIKSLENCAIKSLENVISISSIEDETAGIAVETVSILSSSGNSNDVLTYEKFSSDEVKISNLSNIWDQDLNYTKRTFQSDETNENLIDLTQEFNEHESIESHKEPVSRLVKSSSRNSIKSIEQENLSQESSGSILNLSDDEVNYSIKVARGMNISRESSDHSSSKNDSIEKNTSRTSQTKVDNNFHYDLDTASTSYFHDDRPPYPYLDKTNVESTSAATGEIASEHNTSIDSLNNESRIKSRGFETNEDFCYGKNVPKTSYSHDNRNPNPNDHSTNNDLLNKSNSFDCEKLNFSLAYEIMSHSLLEDDEDSNSECNTEQNEQLVRTVLEEPAYLDLTQTTPSPPTIDNIQSFVDLTDDRNNTSLKSSVKYSKYHSDSFLLPKNTTPKTLKRFSSSRKFSEFISDDAEFSDTDEIDRLIYGSPRRQRKENSADLQGLDQLLTGNINTAKTNDSFEEFTVGNKTYLIRFENVKEKPDYERMDSPTLLKELDKYGLKPFNRKKAIIMLEFIYNQTHPYFVEDSDSDDDENVAENIEVSETAEKSTSLQENSSKKHNSFNLKDCSGACLLIEDGIRPDLPNENFIFQTNVRVKIETARLPLHLAWFNLIKSNEKLREAVLHYEPIDLQEIYIFFKSIGYRYDPKDIKRFFDGRGIIFQYDLTSRQDQRARRKQCHRKRHDR